MTTQQRMEQRIALLEAKLAERGKRKSGPAPTRGTTATKNVTVKLTEAELERLDAAATAAGEHRAKYVRDSIVQRLDREDG